MSYKPSSLQEAWDNHFSAFRTQNLDKILLDYDDNSVVRMHDSVTGETKEFKGLFEMRVMFVDLFDELVDISTLSFPDVRVEEDAKTVFLSWKCPGCGYYTANDNFIFTNDKKFKIKQQIVEVTKKESLIKHRDTHISVIAAYTVPEGRMEEFKGTWPAFYASAAKEPKDSLYFGWCESGNQAICRQAFTNAKALLNQLHQMGIALEMGRIILGEEGRVDVTIVAPSEEIAQLKEPLAVLGAKFFELDASSRWYNKEGAGQDTHLQVAPTFVIPEDKADSFVEIISKFYEGSMSSTLERLYYGWARDGNHFFCRQGFKSAEGVLSHLNDVRGALVDGLDMAGSVSYRVLGPKAEIEKLQATTDDENLRRLRPEFFELDSRSVWL